MQHRARAAGTNDGKVQRRFGGGTAVSLDDAACAIYRDDVAWFEQPFVHAARGDCHSEWLRPDDGAEVAAGAEDPAARVELAAQLAQLPGCILERVHP